MLIDTLLGLSCNPDILMVDGRGIAHPRRFGIASHLGFLFDIPTVGLAKSRLVGRSGTPSRQRGSRTLLIHNEDVVGAVVRTRDDVPPCLCLNWA